MQIAATAKTRTGCPVAAPALYLCGCQPVIHLAGLQGCCSGVRPARRVATPVDLSFLLHCAAPQMATPSHIIGWPALRAGDLRGELPPFLPF